MIKHRVRIGPILERSACDGPSTSLEVLFYFGRIFFNIAESCVGNDCVGRMRLRVPISNKTVPIHCEKARRTRSKKMASLEGDVSPSTPSANKHGFEINRGEEALLEFAVQAAVYTLRRGQFEVWD